MINPYDCRRATEAETLPNLEYVITLGDKIVVNVASLGYASTITSILNQEASIWQKNVDALEARIAELEAKLAERN